MKFSDMGMNIKSASIGAEWATLYVPFARIFFVSIPRLFFLKRFIAMLAFVRILCPLHSSVTFPPFAADYYNREHTQEKKKDKKTKLIMISKVKFQTRENKTN